ncbi:MAG TPA: Pycsar system effector family protein [Candidatus Nanoarchaeia archaeon]|nr:Pycsar system effector family protein [Candidatus Nanoarchaeia archaeon]
MIKKGVNTTSSYPFATYLNTYLSEQIKLADTKGAWTFSVLAAGTATFSAITSKMPVEQLRQFRTLFLFACTIILLTIAFKHVMLVMYPRMGKGTKNRYIYFNDIMTTTKETYIRDIMNTNETTKTKMLLGNAYDLAAITQKKFKHLRLAIIGTLITLGWMAVMLFIL